MNDRVSAILIVSLLITISCDDADKNGRRYDGRLETETVTLSAQLSGTIDSVLAEEGQQVRRGQLLARINADKIRVQRKQKEAQLREIDANLTALNAQIDQARAQYDLVKKNLAKTERMLNEGAATEQKRDELQTQFEVYRSKIAGLNAQKQALTNKQEQVKAALELVAIQLEDARVKAPTDGVVLNRLKEPGEWAAPGQPLLEIADLSKMEATVYVPLDKLNGVRIGQRADVHIDGREEPFTAKVRWIADEAEFTPKTILTEETRTTLVYAVKLEVPNPEGILKIGMPVWVVLK